MIIKRWGLVLVAFALVAVIMGRVGAQEGRVLYVTPNGDFDCSSWETPCTLQVALDTVQDGDQIWVKGGEYFPSMALDEQDPRSVTFQLLNVGSYALYGGFAGTENKLEERNWVINRTTLSGERGELGDITDDAYHVLYSNTLTSPVLLDGFHVILGNADQGNGGGMYNQTSIGLVLNNMTFVSNTASTGGAIYNTGGSMTIKNSAFFFNSAINNGGVLGVYGFNDTTLINVTTAENSTQANSSVIEVYRGDLLVKNSILWDPGAPSEIHLTEQIFSTAAVSYSDTYGGIYAGEGNISADPMFPDVARRRVVPPRGSPVIDRGSDADSQGMVTDLNGNPRFVGTVDMGAYEFTGRVYVDDSATGFNNGQTWATAYTDLREALFMAGAGDEIWVAAGTYVPGFERADTFQLQSGVAIYGGFAGKETSRDQRNWQVNQTILSGEIGEPGMHDNSHNVVTGIYTDENAVLDGFTITAGNEDRGENTFGGGIFVESGSPSFSNLIITGNNSTYCGGGMGLERSNSSLANILFTNNTAASCGGALHIGAGAPTLVNITFYGNVATNASGAIYNDWGDPQIINSIVWGNVPENQPVVGGGKATVLYSDIQGGYEGEGNIDQDPLFVDAAKGDLRLLPGSPAIDKGTNEAVQLPYDLDGQQRIINNTVDLGAYEYYYLIYVNANATGENTGESWANAYTDLQDALASASAGDEIWVAAGTYLPGETRTASFSLKSGVAVYGGFAGNETTRDARNWQQNPAILSGDIGKQGYAPDNSIHIVTSVGTSQSILDGFTIRDGYADGEPFVSGGGMYISGSETLVQNVIFSNNFSSYKGGGLFATGGGAPSLTSVSFTDNQANFGGGIAAAGSDLTIVHAGFLRNTGTYEGGGIHLDTSSSSLTDIYFFGNTSERGGGLFVFGTNGSGDPQILDRVQFSGNTAGSTGGAINVSESTNLQLTSVVFVGNQAGSTGGAIYNEGGTGAFVNVTFSGNSALNYGAMWNGAGAEGSMTNSIVWNNPSDKGAISASGLAITHSVIQGGYPGAGNLDQDPLFADADGLDGRFGSLDDDLTLQTISPALDAGDNNALSESDNADLTGSPRIVNARVDLGAYELLKPVYVDDSAEGANNGKTWKDAYTDLQDALSTATAENQVWVATGVYRPAGTDRSASFGLPSGLGIYGGFNGSETSLKQRRWTYYPTVLSGDIGAAGDASDNSYHVVVASGRSSVLAQLNGFIIMDGNANGEGADGQGGGIRVSGTVVRLDSLVFIQNTAIEGGGMYVSGAGTSIVMRNLTFTTNQASRGGGLYNATSPLVILNSFFRGNSASDDSMSGGGLYNQDGASALLENVVFDGNKAVYGGGSAIANQSGEGNTSVAVINGTFYANDGMAEGSVVANNGTGAYIKNSILWGNNGPLVSGEGFTSFAFSLVEGSNGSGEGWNSAYGHDGTGNIDANPLFLDANGADGKPGNGDDSLRVSVLHSPAHDAGSNNLLLPSMITDISGFKRIQNLSVDMGAYENENTVWTFAEPLAAEDLKNGIAQELVQEGEARWYKIPVNPDDHLAITLSSLPEDYDLVLLGDLDQAYRKARIDLHKVQEELGTAPDVFSPDVFSPDVFSPDVFSPDVFSPDVFSPDVFSPDFFSPDVFSPDVFSPDVFSPDVFSPDVFSPDVFSPDVFSPDVFSPDVFSPDVFSPDVFSPDVFSPDVFSPDVFSPDVFSPDVFSPDVFSPEGQAMMTKVQRSKAIAVSNNRGLLPEEIQRYVWSNKGYYYIRVRGYQGANHDEDSYHLDVDVESGACQGMLVQPEIPTLDLAEGSYKTLVITDLSRLAQPDDLDLPNLGLEDLNLQLDRFLADARVNGTLVDVSEFEGEGYRFGNIAALHEQAESNITCTYAMNLVADGIKQVIDQYRAKYPLEYIVLLGSDYVVPFFRHPDMAEMGNENTYDERGLLLLDDSTSRASLANNLVLTQDDYGASAVIEQSSKLNGGMISEIIAVPDLAVGRLVETPDQITHMLQLFNDTPSPFPAGSALVAGYDFMVDAAEEVEKNLIGAGVASVDSTLIYKDPLSSTEWDGPAFQSKLVTFNPDILFVGAHADANMFLSAKGNYVEDAGLKTRIWTNNPEENLYDNPLIDAYLGQAGIDWTNGLAISMGCHAGYNVVDQHFSFRTEDGKTVALSLDPDWAEYFAERGATWVSGTGFQYGNTDLLLYSERLYANFVLTLRKVRPAGSPPGTSESAPVGKALVNAKRAFLCQADENEVGGTHTKALREMTLYGLPMATFALNSVEDTSAPTGGPVLVSPDLPGAAAGLQEAVISADNYVLKNGDDADPPAYYVIEGKDPCLNQTIASVSAVPGDPVLPLVKEDLTAAGQTARGVVFSGGNYTDESVPVSPKIANLSFDGITSDLPFYSPEFYPADMWGITRTDSLSTTADGRTYLSFTPVQHRTIVNSQPGGVGAQSAMLLDSGLTQANRRKFASAEFTVYYMPLTAEGQQAVLYASPAEILTEQAWLEQVDDIPTAIHWQVNTGRTGDSKAVRVVVAYTFEGSGQWLSLDLSTNPNQPDQWLGAIPAGQYDPMELHYIVQVVSDTGLVTLKTNEDLYYNLGLEPGTPPSGDTRAETSMQVTLTGGGDLEPGDPIDLTSELTSLGSGVAGQVIIFTLNEKEQYGVTGPDGNAAVSFAGLPAGSYQGTARFAGSTEFQASESVLVIELNPLQEKERTSLFLQAPSIGSMTVSGTLVDAGGDPIPGKLIGIRVGSEEFLRLTGSEGQFTFLLDPGTYPKIEASFGTIPFEDADYQPSQGSLEDVTILPIPATLLTTGDTAVRAGSLITLRARLDYAVPSDFPRYLGRVKFEIQETSGNLISQVEAQPDDSGVVSAVLPAPAPGIYRIVVRETSIYFDAGPVTVSLAVFDPAGAFLTGGGWYNVSNQKASFNLNSKYPKGMAVPSGSVNFQLGNLSFQSSTLEYLAASPSVAQVKGTGKVNGSSGYGFLVTVVDGPLTGGRADRFRIKIWNLATSAVVYDTQPGSGATDLVTTLINGGDITIHK